MLSPLRIIYTAVSPVNFMFHTAYINATPSLWCKILKRFLCVFFFVLFVFFLLLLVIRRCMFFHIHVYGLFFFIRIKCLFHSLVFVCVCVIYGKYSSWEKRKMFKLISFSSVFGSLVVAVLNTQRYESVC